jgi:Tfp pilus assembly protein PilW
MRIIKNRGKKINNKNKTGFTLVEVLLYSVIAGVVLMAISFFLSILLQARIKGQVMAEVEQVGVQTMQIFTQTARNATAINSPAAGTSGVSTSLTVIEGAKSPTVFDLFGGIIRIKEGTSAAVNITSSKLTATGLAFTNLSGSGTKGTVRIQFTLTYRNPSGRNEYNYTKTFYGSATLR